MSQRWRLFIIVAVILPNPLIRAVTSHPSEQKELCQLNKKLLNTQGISQRPKEGFNTEQAKKMTYKYKKDSIIVKFKPEVTNISEEGEILIYSESILKLNKRFGLVKIERVIKSPVTPDRPEYGLKDIYLLIFRPDAEINIEDIIKAYSKNPDVIYAEPNYIFQTQGRE